MVGISASGKSTIAKGIQASEKEVSEIDYIIISSDEIRGSICEGGVSDQSKNDEVFKIFHQSIKDNLLNGMNVIADATNINLKSRRSLLDNVKNIDCDKIAYIIPKSIENCIEDNIYKDNPVPHHVIQKQMMNFQVPFIEEGFDDIWIHLFPKEYELTVYDMFDKMKGYDQKNPHHDMTLDKHCMNVSSLLKKKDYYPSRYILAAKIHDIGKLYTQKFDDEGVAHYFQHENVGCYNLLSNYNNLDMIESDILDMCFLINYHMLPMNWNTEKAHRKWKKIFGEYNYQLLLDFHECDKERN